MRLNWLIIIVTVAAELITPRSASGQQNPNFGDTYQLLCRFIDTALIPMKAGSSSLAFSLRAEVDKGGTLVKVDCSTNLAASLKPRLFKMKDLSINWNKFTGKTGRYYVVIPVYFSVEHASGKILINSRTEFTNGFYFDDGDLFDNKTLNNYYFLKPVYLQRYF
jgi:hypothetical protein